MSNSNLVEENRPVRVRHSRVDRGHAIAQPTCATSGTICGMATNLRLRPEAEEAVRARAASTGRSQQEIIREALDRYLGLSQTAAPRSAAEVMMTAQGVLPVRTAYRELDELAVLQHGANTIDLLDREERF